MQYPKVMILNLPSPPGMDVHRDYSGSYGTAGPVKRSDYGHTGDIVFPVFMPYLATMIKREGYKLKIVDAQAGRLDLKSTLEHVQKEQPQFIISMVSLPSIYGDLNLLDAIKEKLPDSAVLLVGAIVKFLWREIFEKSKVDFLVSGEYPFYARPIVELINAAARGTKPGEKEIPGLLSRNQPKPALSLSNGDVLAMWQSSEESSGNDNLNDLDIDIYNEFPLDQYKLHLPDLYGRSLNFFPILSAKGCPFSCAYCPYPIGFGNKISYKSPDILVKEMEYLKRAFGIEAFLIRDQVFTANAQRVERICDLILAKELKVSWLFETRVDMVSEHLLRKAKYAGCCRIHYGVESGNEDLLSEIAKPGVGLETIRKAFQNTSKLEIFTMAQVLIGLPGENGETLDDAYKFLLDLDPDAVAWNLAVPYPGTKLFEVGRQKNMILTYNWAKYTGHQAVMRTEELSAEQLLRIMKRFDRKFQINKILGRAKNALFDRKDLEFLSRRIIHKLRRAAGGFSQAGTWWLKYLRPR